MMKKSWIDTLAYGFLALALLSFAVGGVFFSSRPASIPPLETVAKKYAPQKNAFAASKEAYSRIDSPVLHLNALPVAMQLPDLKKTLVYYGKNGRPDAKPEQTQMHFAFSGNKVLSSTLPANRLYLYYNRSLKPPQYVFSPDNAPTSIWIEPTLQGNEALIRVSMKDDEGELVKGPESNAEFTLPEKEYIRFGGTPWEIGKQRVDGTLLARQKARWVGLDKFLERHGGKEFAEMAQKQRIDFAGDEVPYAVFVSVGDTLVWDTDRWKMVTPGPASIGKPLMIVKKIDERLMTLELWDVDGKGKMNLNLLRSPEAWSPQQIVQGIKFVGARTRSQFIFEMDGERLTLSPQDWLLMTENGWKKLAKLDEIDDYVNRKTIGTLFILDGMERRDGGQFLKGALVSPARTEIYEIEIPAQAGASALSNPVSKKDDKANPVKRKSSIEMSREVPSTLKREPVQDEMDDEAEDDED